LVGLADSNEAFWREVSKLLSNADSDLYSEEPWPIAWWTRKASKNVIPLSDDEEYFWIIANNLLENATAKDIDDDSDIIGTAINNPIGIITEALIDRFTQCKLEAGEGIPKPSYLSLVNRIMNEDKGMFLLGRVILASRLQYFYAVDPEWAEKHLLPKLDWKNNTEAKFIWQGYLCVPRITADLARELRDFILDAISKSDLIDKYRDRLYQLFVFICLEYPDLYTTSIQREAMTSLGKEGLESVSEFFWRSVSDEQENRDVYWENRIKPFIARAWPKIGNLTSPKVSNYFALMCLQLDSAFSDAVDTVKPFLVPGRDLGFFIRKVKNSPLIKKYPLKMFELLSSVFSTDYQLPDKSLRELITEIQEAAPEVEQYPKFIEINEYLLQCDL